MTKEEAIQVMEELALFDVDNEGHSAPSNMEIGVAIRVLGMPDSYDAYSEAIDGIELIDDGDDEED